MPGNLAVIGVITLLLAGLLGVVAIWKDYRDPQTGKMTLLGKLAGGVMIVSVVLSIVAHMITIRHERDEQLKAARSAEKAAQQALLTVRNLERLLTATDTMQVSVDVFVPDSALQPFPEWLARTARDSMNDAEFAWTSFTDPANGQAWNARAMDVFARSMTVQIYDRARGIPPCPTDAETGFILKRNVGSDSVPPVSRAQLSNGFQITAKAPGMPLVHPDGRQLSLADFRQSYVVLFTEPYFRDAQATVEEFPPGSTESPFALRDAYSGTRRRPFPRTAAAAREVSEITLAFDKQRSLQTTTVTRHRDQCTGLPFEVLTFPDAG